MAATPTARKSIATIREWVACDSKKDPADSLSMAVHHLGLYAREIMMDPVLLDDVLKLGEEVAAFRGKGSQSAAQNMSRLFGFMIMELVNGLRKSDGGIDLIPSACDGIPSSAPAWEALKKLGARAVECVRGPQSRSQHTSLLRAEAWWQLGEISEVARDPGHLAIALNVAGNKRAPSKSMSENC